MSIATNLTDEPLMGNVKELQEVFKKNGAIYVENHLNLSQRQALNVLLAYADRYPSQTGVYHIDIQELSETIGYGKDLKKLSEMLGQLKKLVIEWNIFESKSWGEHSVLAGYTVINGRTLAYSFDPILMQHFLDKKENYTRLSLLTQKRFKSHHAISLWEVCEQRYNVRLGRGETPFYKYEDVRKLFGFIDLSKYPEFKTFKKWVINVAVDEINQQSDLHVTVLLKKKNKGKGGRVTHIKFLIELSKQNDISPEKLSKLMRTSEAQLSFNLENFDLSPLNSPERKNLKNVSQEIIDAFKDLHITPQQLKSLSTQYPQEPFLEIAKYMKDYPQQNKPIARPLSFLKQILKNGFEKPQTPTDPKKTAEKKRPPESINPQTFEDLKKFGIADNDAHQLIANHLEEQIRYKLAAVRWQAWRGKNKDKPQALLQALRESWFFEEFDRLIDLTAQIKKQLVFHLEPEELEGWIDSLQLYGIFNEGVVFAGIPHPLFRDDIASNHDQLIREILNEILSKSSQTPKTKKRKLIKYCVGFDLPAFEELFAKDRSTVNLEEVLEGAF